MRSSPLRVNIGDAKSPARQPASTTHRQPGPGELEKCGVSEDRVRWDNWAGIDDLKADLEQALAAVRQW